MRPIRTATLCYRSYIVGAGTPVRMRRRIVSASAADYNRHRAVAFSLRWRRLANDDDDDAKYLVSIDPVTGQLSSGPAVLGAEPGARSRVIVVAVNHFAASPPLLTTSSVDVTVYACDVPGKTQTTSHTWHS